MHRLSLNTSSSSPASSSDAHFASELSPAYAQIARPPPTNLRVVLLSSGSKASDSRRSSAARPLAASDADGGGGSRCVLASRSPPSRRVVAARVPAGACCDAARPTVDRADGSLAQYLASLAARSMSSAVLQRAALKVFYVNYQVFLDHCLDSYGCECTRHLANVLLVPYTAR